ncbi:unnamed protein product [Brassica oleracea]
MSLAQLVLLAGMPSAEFFAHWSVLLPAIKSSETSASFIRFIQLLTAHHASRRCRKGAAEILDVPRGYYMFCRGSRNDSRGFSCGLWVLFHSLSVRIEDGESQFAFTAICDFVNNFFMCDECRLHFIDMCLR